MMYDSKTIVGSEEWCGLAALHIPAIKVRVDSGARTSAIHAFNIKPFKRGGMPWVRFELHPLQKNITTTVECEAEVVDRRQLQRQPLFRQRIGRALLVVDWERLAPVALTREDGIAQAVVH